MKTAVTGNHHSQTSRQHLPEVVTLHIGTGGGSIADHDKTDGSRVWRLPHARAHDLWMWAGGGARRARGVAAVIAVIAVIAASGRPRGHARRSYGDTDHRRPGDTAQRRGHARSGPRADADQV